VDIIWIAKDDNLLRIAKKSYFHEDRRHYKTFIEFRTIDGQRVLRIPFEGSKVFSHECLIERIGRIGNIACNLLRLFQKRATFVNVYVASILPLVLKFEVFVHKQFIKVC
jgi:hypothetical protein